MIKVLVVDDSSFFCRRVASLLNEDVDIKVVGIAANGKEAIEKVKELKPNVITMDVEMPVMDGITALRTIMEIQPTPTLMLSSLTYEGAKLTLDALDAGAVDFQLKSYESIANSDSQNAVALREKVKEIAKVKNYGVSAEKSKLQNLKPATELKEIQERQPVSESKKEKPAVKEEVKLKKETSTTSSQLKKQSIKLIAIGASTGGPVAVQHILMHLPSKVSCPILITQHMPATFTGAFAARMDGLCEITVKEAEDRMLLEAGCAYIAPGGKQTYVEGNESSSRLRVRDTDSRLMFAPCIDVTYVSAAKVFSGDVLAIILTGMGSDGCEGAKILHNKGAMVWAQDKATSVVYGMPSAIMRAGIADEELALGQMADRILRVV